MKVGRRAYTALVTPFLKNDGNVDFESLEDKAVTVRDRDTMKQERVKIKELNNYFESKLK